LHNLLYPTICGGYKLRFNWVESSVHIFKTTLEYENENIKNIHQRI